MLSIVRRNLYKMSKKIILIDLSGTLHIDDIATENAVGALKKLRESNKISSLKFVTNTTKESRQTLHKRLTSIGFELTEDEIYSSLTAASNFVRENLLKPFCLLSLDAKNDFPPTCRDGSLSDENYDSVVVGLAPTEFIYENLNRAFRILMNNKKLIAIHEGRYYRRKDGLALGPGAFVKGLEYATSTKAILIGKPNEQFFRGAIPKDQNPSDCIMIGDDANDDISGAIAIGMKGILVKTGKYLPGSEEINPRPTIVVENFASAVDWILDNNF